MTDKKKRPPKLIPWLRKRWAKTWLPLVWVVAACAFAAVVYQVCWATDAADAVERAWAFLITCGGAGVFAASLVVIALIADKLLKASKGK